VDLLDAALLSGGVGVQSGGDLKPGHTENDCTLINHSSGIIYQSCRPTT
jgi:hypothetical protein